MPMARPLRIAALAVLMVAEVAAQEEARAVRKGDYLYFQRTAAGRPTHCRCESFAPSGATGGSCAEGAEVEVLLDEATLGADVKLSFAAASPDHQLFAYAAAAGADYTVTIKDLKTGSLLPGKLSAAQPQVVWGKSQDGTSALYYVNAGGELWRHTPGGGEDTLLYSEEGGADSEFELQLSQTTDERWLLAGLHSSDTSEVHILRLDEPETEAGQALQLVAARKSGVKYDVDIRHESHLTDYNRKIYQSTLYIRTNWAPPLPQFRNLPDTFRIMRIGMTDLSRGMNKCE